jgi:hypothetical protein
MNLPRSRVETGVWAALKSSLSGHLPGREEDFQPRERLASVPCRCRLSSWNAEPASGGLIASGTLHPCSDRERVAGRARSRRLQWRIDGYARVNRDYAASWYSWISPPRRSRQHRRSRSIVSAAGSSVLSGGRCPSARCGRCSLKCWTYATSTCWRWRWPMISGRSRHSRRTLPIQRSAWARAFGARTGALMTRIPSERKISSNSRLNLLSRSRIGTDASRRACRR